jgi:hypothetical protein
VAVSDYELAMHLISAHCDPMAVCRFPPDNADQHEYEHAGPGTIRSHPGDSLAFDEQKVEDVLEEAEANP